MDVSLKVNRWTSRCLCAIISSFEGSVGRGGGQGCCMLPGSHKLLLARVFHIHDPNVQEGHILVLLLLRVLQNLENVLRTLSLWNNPQYKCPSCLSMHWRMCHQPPVAHIISNCFAWEKPFWAHSSNNVAPFTIVIRRGHKI
ncbi:hypothetical protein MPTK1_3g17270 [Marchantia polymorpha subsp. ruderalis]|uniref:Uncharacterized protein n=2 Tax=Marchantia polymorpha TaxID=3197 RepID=A0AAF6B1R6_MARPO|nr:hypothetical protein MARPO_0039s0067 [Marchantia polymorpha]BBN05950.1 hypothetical protein Mp_3g17270 [Marchantia polymorpha subsp. ruderalis]|eukprot:PTQ40574.1 hypothetical protein MARPO_0039s0067 [Marchantia polymorpha]